MIRELDAEEAQTRADELGAVLHDCVENGASVSFMAGFSRREATQFFEGVAQSVARRERVLLAAFVDDELVGTVQLVPATAPNQPHRADVAKLLVKRSARSQGVATQLMRAVEQAGWALGKTTLVLDTVTGGEAERLYVKLGWTRVGEIPDYCLWPDGRLCGTTIFYKKPALNVR